MRNQRGITLVALVITIIVLLILAAVTIAALGGSNGILTNASKSQVANELGEARDLVGLAANEGVSDYYTAIYVNGTSESTVGSKQKVVADKITALGATIGSDTKLAVEDEVNSEEPPAPTGKKKVTLTSKNGKGTATATIDANGTLSSWTVTINN